MAGLEYLCSEQPPLSSVMYLIRHTVHQKSLITRFLMQLLYQEENPGIEFEYSLPSGAVAETPEEGEGYDWSSTAWTECDAVCGGGYRQRYTQCGL